MPGSPGQNTPYMNQLLYGIKADVIAECEAALIEEYEAHGVEEYKRADKRERDILWMKHRNLRIIFDQIEKTYDFKK
jgi:hypothetical protein